MEELRPGLWTWTAPHPAWTPAEAGPEGWEREVRCAAVPADGEVVLIDPLEPPVELTEDREVSVVLTCAWHSRSAGECIERHGATVYAPRTGIERLSLPAEPYDVDDQLPGGVVAAAAYYPEEVVLWIPALRTMFAGDAFTAQPLLRFQRSWLPDGLSVATALDALRPLLELPVEVVLVGHGVPVTDDARGALRRALEA